MDDILIVDGDLDTVNEIKQWLKSQFGMKDIGEAKYVLGIKIIRDWPNLLLTLSHESYLKTVLKWFDMMTCKLIDTPISRSEKLSRKQGSTTEEDKELIRGKPCAQIVGSICQGSCK